MTNTSVTLEETGIAEAINDGGPYDSARNKMMALDYATQLPEMKAIAGQPDYALGSVHAVTRDGTLVIASASGSQLASYAWGAANVIFVVGAQKLVPDPGSGARADRRAQPEARGRPRLRRLRAEQPRREGPRDPPGAARAHPRRPHPAVGRVLRSHGLRPFRLEFGYFLIPDAGDPRGVLETARLADRLGYDLLAVQDHPYQPAHLDSLALLGVILGQTEQIRVFQDVGNLPLRPPAVFAKAAATLDLLSGGRFEAGLGGGGFLRAAAGDGRAGPSPSGESLEALEEAVAILRASWSGARSSCASTGRHYRLEGARPGPAPAHQIGIWLGAAKPRALALTGRVADGWAAPLMNYMPPAAAADAQTLIDRAAREAGRDPGEIRRIYNMPGAFTAAAPAPARDTDEAIVGPPDHWAEVLTHLALDLGFGTFVLIAPARIPDMLRTFIEDVAPQVRERVATARALDGAEERHATGA